MTKRISKERHGRVDGTQQFDQLESSAIPDKLDIRAPRPKWLQNLWRGTAFSETVIEKTIKVLENNDLWLAGDGSVRDQIWSYAWCLSNKSTHEPYFHTSGPVDGDRYNMRALRAEA